MHEIEEGQEHEADDNEDGNRGAQQARVRQPELEAQQPGANQRANHKTHLQYQHQHRPATQQRGKFLINIDFFHRTSSTLSSC